MALSFILHYDVLLFWYLPKITIICMLQKHLCLNNNHNFHFHRYDALINIIFKSITALKTKLIEQIIYKMEDALTDLNRFVKRTIIY